MATDEQQDRPEQESMASPAGAAPDAEGVQKPLRLFVAIDPPETVRNRLQQVQRAGGVRWVPVEQLHLTLLFLGNVPADRLEPLSRELAAIREREFTLTLGELGCFPAMRAPRVLWIGLERQPLLDSLAAAVRQTADVCDLPLEEKPFTPHITLGRVKEPAHFQLRPWLQHAAPQHLSFHVREFALIRSLMTPQGAVHRQLQAFPLTSGDE